MTLGTDQSLTSEIDVSAALRECPERRAVMAFPGDRLAVVSIEAGGQVELIRWINPTSTAAEALQATRSGDYDQSTIRYDRDHFIWTTRHPLAGSTATREDFPW